MALPAPPGTGFRTQWGLRYPELKTKTLKYREKPDKSLINHVKWLQQALNLYFGGRTQPTGGMGTYIPLLTVDGHYGQNTANVVTTFQSIIRSKRYDDSVYSDGITGPATWKYVDWMVRGLNVWGNPGKWPQ